ncbi:MAG: archaeosortase/exosortase family protein [Sulfurovum sp.]|nr:archaeosortase/exosortase family protein [Sulfurovum sp.]
MKQFVALYFLFLGLLFVLFYAPILEFSTILNDGQTKLTLYFLDFFLKSGQLKGIDIWIHPQYKIIINQSCNGVIPILFLVASILAYPSSVLHKILWIFIGYAVFSIVNVLRILLVVYATEYGEGQGEFYWSHDLVGNFLLMVTGLILFVLFIKTSSKTIKNFES